VSGDRYTVVVNKKKKSRARKARASRHSTAATPTGGGSTLSEFLRFISADILNPDWLPAWPPDAYAITAALLRRTGSYVQLVNGYQDRTTRTITADKAEEIGKRWRDQLNAALGGVTDGMRKSCPPEVVNWWRQIQKAAPKSLSEAASNSVTVAAAINICIVADSASAGIGVELGDDPFLAVAEVLREVNEAKSFCFKISADKLAVLGKQHTPQRGCTIRSLSHHLALYAPVEIQARWWGPYSPAHNELDVFNLLLLPWPLKVSAADFKFAQSRNGQGGASNGRDPYRYFDYEPAIDRRTPEEFATHVMQAIEAAKVHADQIHGVVFPELSLSPEEFAAVEQQVVKNKALLIAGIRGTGDSDTEHMPLNYCAIQPAGLTAGFDAEDLEHLLPTMRRHQLKHHRWCLDRGQILQYELGGRLPASRDCWERIYIGEREVNFVSLADWLTVCVLICEDLARQDPVSDVIRAVGPNLVFALLMDGPQLKSRWASRYASVLAEDPGCSVLSLTSAGMARRSRPPEGSTVDNKSTVIGLWRDAIYGDRHIQLEEGHDACVLSLVCKSMRELAIDGRGDANQAHFPVFAGSYSFKSSTEPGS
jgi:hypothetical protein